MKLNLNELTKKIFIVWVEKWGLFELKYGVDKAKRVDLKSSCLEKTFSQ